MLARDGCRIVFMGSPEFALPSLERLVANGYTVAGVYTQPDRAVGRGRRLQPPPIKRFALQTGLPVYQPARLGQPEAIAELEALQPDLIVIVAYGQILRPPVLAIPTQGTINVHASLLPRYRGASPIATAILDGAEETGVSIMLVDERMDTGPVLAQRREPIRPQDTTGTLSARLAMLGADLLVETLPQWLAGSVEPRPQNNSEATITRLIKKEDGLIDWRRPAEELWRQIRAYTPWPGSTTTLDGTPLRLLQAWPANGQRGTGNGQQASGDEGGEPGSIVPFHGRVDLPAGLPKPVFAVVTGSGLLLPLELQRAGKRQLSARDFANGARHLLSRRFGS